MEEQVIEILLSLGWKPAGRTPIYWKTFRTKSVKFGGRLRFKRGRHHTASIGPLIVVFYNRKMKWPGVVDRLRVRSRALVQGHSALLGAAPAPGALYVSPGSHLRMRGVVALAAVWLEEFPGSDFY